MSAARALVAALGLLASPAFSAAPATHVVCPEGATEADCRYRGGSGIQAAVDAAASGDTVLLRPGHYVAAAWREIPYQDVKVRGFVVIDGKDLRLEGDPGAVLDGATGLPTTAIIVRNGRVTVRGLTLSGFRYDVQEDDYYEGHGLFVIDARVLAEDLVIDRFQKMGLVGRGASVLEARRLSIVDGHVGIWLHETAYLSLADSEVNRNDSSAIAAYDDSVVHAIDVRFEGNLDDGLFTEHRATIYARRCQVRGNKPYGARAVGDSTIWLDDCVLDGNAKDTTGKYGRARVRFQKR